MARMLSELFFGIMNNRQLMTDTKSQYEADYEDIVDGVKSREYDSFVRELRTWDSKEIFSLMSEKFEVLSTQGDRVRSPKQVFHSKRGTVVEINELLFPLLINKYQDLVLCFYEIDTPRGVAYHSQLLHRNVRNSRWVGIERTDQWLSGKLDGLVGTFDYIKDNTKQQLQKHYNGRVVYAGSGIVSLSGGGGDIASYVERVKRFYKPE